MTDNGDTCILGLVFSRAALCLRQAREKRKPRGPYSSTYVSFVDRNKGIAVTLRCIEKLRFDKHVGQNGVAIACVIRPSLRKHILIVNRGLQVDGGSYIIIFRTQMSFYIYIYIYTRNEVC